MDKIQPAAKTLASMILKDSLRRTTSTASLTMKNYDLDRSWGHKYSFSSSRGTSTREFLRSRPSSPAVERYGSTLHEVFNMLMKTLSESKRHHTAVRFDAQTLTYGQLARLSDSVAAFLQGQAKTSSPGVLLKIAVLTERTLETVPIIFGILKMGASYIPVDPHWSVERIETVLNETKPHILICDRVPQTTTEISMEIISWRMFLVIAADYSAYFRRLPLSAPHDEDDTAVILHDSETMQSYELSHKLILHRLAAHWEKLHFADNETVLVKSDFHSLNVLVELFGTLLVGQTALFLPVDICSKKPSLLLDILETFPIRRLFLTPEELTHLLLYVKESKREFYGALKLILVQQNDSLLTRGSVEELFDVFAPCKLGYTYSVWELAGEIAWCIFDDKEDFLSHLDQELIPVGTPITPEFELLIKDSDMQNVRNGETGTLFVNCNWFKRPVTDAVFTNGYDEVSSFDESGDLVRTGQSAFLHEQTGYLYIIPPPPCPPEPGVSDDIVNNTETPPIVNEDVSEDPDVTAPLPLPIVSAPLEVSPQMKEAAMGLLLSGMFSGSQMPDNATNELRSQIAQYAQTIFDGLEPREFVFVVTDADGESCGVGMAYDPFQISDDLWNLMYPMTAKNETVYRALKPLRKTLPHTAGCVVDLYLMTVDDSLSDEEKFSIYCQIDSELEKRARRLGYQFTMTTSFDALMQRVSAARGYQRWAQLQLNRLCLPSGMLPFVDRPDSETVTLDVLPLIPLSDIPEALTPARERTVSFAGNENGLPMRHEFKTVDSFVEEAADWLLSEIGHSDEEEI